MSCLRLFLFIAATGTEDAAGVLVELEIELL